MHHPAPVPLHATPSCTMPAVIIPRPYPLPCIFEDVYIHTYINQAFAHIRHAMAQFNALLFTHCLMPHCLHQLLDIMRALAYTSIPPHQCTLLPNTPPLHHCSHTITPVVTPLPQWSPQWSQETLSPLHHPTATYADPGMLQSHHNPVVTQNYCNTSTALAAAMPFGSPTNA
jgi:hypothetical protein